LEQRRDEPGLRSESIRRVNLSSIARELHMTGSLSRSALGVRTGLTRSTIRSLIGEFSAAGLVSEIGPAALGTPGRPSVVVTPNASRPVVLALEVAVDSIAGAVVGFGGEIRQKRRVERPRGHLSLDQTVRDLADLARSLDAFHARRGDVAGVGVAIAGVVRRSDGLVSVAPNLSWRDVALGEALRQALGAFVAVDIANEADLGALAETRRGAGRGCQNIIFVQGEVGVGGGLFVDGHPLAGAAGYAGEVGHMPINPNGEACHCGSVGCWETEIGEDALLTRAGHPRGGGRGEMEAVLREAASGEQLALVALDHVGRWLGIGLAGLVNLLNPERIVLGGRFGRLFPFIRETVAAQIERYALQAPRQLVTVVPAQLGEEASLIGAAELAFEPLLVDPAAWLGPRSNSISTLASA
jgi:predicted NBD/HSP70 family sugar kinase